ncbi:MAG TPA: alpha/beta hydrolase [Fimbriiglobus sp.]
MFRRAICTLLVLGVPVFAQDLRHKEDVIYGRKYGMCLTMDVFTPAKPNGIGVIACVSGGWGSGHAGVKYVQNLEKPLLDRGYTVFAVVHGSQPKFTIPEVLEDMHRAARFIRFHAKDYNIDPDKLGITGASSGGHLSLMQGVGGLPGNPKAGDPVDRVSSTVQCVGCFFPPTDFFNYGKTGKPANPGGDGVLKPFRAPFDFHEFKDGAFERITDPERVKAINRAISPVYLVSKDSAPTLLIHGDKDDLVPLQQSELMIAKLKEAGVPCKLVIKKGGGHGWGEMDKDVVAIADWFDKYLMKKSSSREDK